MDVPDDAALTEGEDPWATGGHEVRPANPGRSDLRESPGGTGSREKL